jgi:molybdate/tungstate transport system ATP-binding protein
MTLDVTGLRTAHAGFEFGPVDLTVGREVLAVLGPSGSGKTTLLSSVAGIVRPDAGSVLLDGRELVGRPLEARRVGMVFQDGALFPHMTARENVAYAAASDGRVEELASALELDGVLERRPPTLSGGERQRVALARTLAADPDVLLLDEPLASLDAPIRRRLRDVLHEVFASLDVPIVYVTHDQRTATALGDRLAIVRDGTLEQVGSPETVLDRPASRFVARFTGTDNLFEGRVVGGSADGARVRFGDVRLRTAAPADGGSAVTVCIPPSRVDLGAADAEGDGAANALTGTVVRRLNEGHDYRVDVDVEGAPAPLTATVRPPTVARLTVEVGAELRVLVPRESVHLIRDGEPSR